MQNVPPGHGSQSNWVLTCSIVKALLRWYPGSHRQASKDVRAVRVMVLELIGHEMISVSEQNVFSGHGTQKESMAGSVFKRYPELHKQASAEVAVVTPAAVFVLAGHCVLTVPVGQYDPSPHGSHTSCPELVVVK